MSELHNAKKYHSGSSVAPQTPIPRYPIGQQTCCCIPMMGVFELHNAKTYCLGSGVPTQTPIPLYPIRHKTCFWVPRMVLFELHNAKKHPLGSGVAPQAPIPFYPIGQLFGYLEWGCLDCTMPKINAWFLGWGPKHPYHCTL